MASMEGGAFARVVGRYSPSQGLIIFRVIYTDRSLKKVIRIVDFKQNWDLGGCQLEPEKIYDSLTGELI